MGVHEHASDAALLRATRTDPSAFAEFYDRYEAVLVTYFAGRTHDPELTADLTAEVFASALEHAHSFDEARAAGANAAPWLFGIARNTLLKSLRRGRVMAGARKRLKMIEPLALDEDGFARVEAVESIEPDVSRLLDELPEDQRAALIARFVEERGYDDIAAQLKCSELVIRKRVSRGLASLRSALSSTPKEKTQ